MVVSAQRRTFSFADFTVDLRAGELRRDGIRLKLAGQPFAVLAMLLDHRGEVVTREELRARLWQKETFVDFDHSLNVAINKLRETLCDSPEQPRFIETIPRTGYRFIGPVAESSAMQQQKAREQGSAVAAKAEQARAGTALRKHRVVVLAAAVVLLALVIAGYLRFHPAPKLTDKDTIVLADFANATGDPVFDDTLRQGLAVQLEQSPFLSLISDDRIQQMLSLMAKPAGARLTPEVAREICQRTGSAAVLDGSIASLGSQYVLTLRAKDCHSGDVLDEEQAQAGRKEDVLNALSQIASRFRTRIGESLATVKSHDTSLADATTPSLEALKAYSAGWQASFSSGAAAAIPFENRAIEIDPNFASAYASIGRFYADIGESVLSASSLSRAYQLRDRATDQEKFFISVNYDLEVTGNLQKAEQTCDLWIQTYPRAWVPHALLSGGVYPVLGKYEKGTSEARTAIGIDPDFSIGYVNLAVGYVALDRWADAEKALRQAADRKIEIPDFVVSRYIIAFMKDDRAAMERETSLAQREPGADDWMANSEAFVLAYSGHLREARNMSRAAVDFARKAGRPDTQALYETDEAMREAVFGNTVAARQKAGDALKLSKSRDVEYGAAFALGLSGDSSRSQALANDLSRRFGQNTRVQFTYGPTLRALAALKRGEPSKAIESLQTALPYELGIPTEGASEFFLGAGNLYPAYVRGLAYLSARQGREAAIEFQKIVDHRGVVIADPIGALAHLQLGRAYALAGDRMKARSAYRDFLALWKDADPGIPILGQAKSEYGSLP